MKLIEVKEIDRVIVRMKSERQVLTSGSINE